MVQAQGIPQRVAVIGGDRLPPLWTELKRATSPWPVVSVRAREPVACGAAVLAMARSGVLGEPAGAVQEAPVLDSVAAPAPEGDPHGPAFREFLARI